MSFGQNATRLHTMRACHQPLRHSEKKMRNNSSQVKLGVGKLNRSRLKGFQKGTLKGKLHFFKRRILFRMFYASEEKSCLQNVCFCKRKGLVATPFALDRVSLPTPDNALHEPRILVEGPVQPLRCLGQSLADSI